MHTKTPLSRVAVITGCVTAATLGAVTTGASTCGSAMTTYQVPMRDGVLLSTDAYTSINGEPAPTILFRTPYGKESDADKLESFLEEGYSVVNQDLRGTGESEGTFMLWTDDGWGANQDGYDTVEWASAGDWSTGDTCIWGTSALGITGLMAAGAAPPSLRCGYFSVSTGDIFHVIAYQGGALRIDPAVYWLEGGGAYEALEAVYAHPTDDAFWDPISLQDRYDQVQVPIYHYGGWYDVMLQGTLDAFSGLHNEGGEGARGRQKMIIGPWTHGGTSGELTYPENSSPPSGEDDRWFEYWLKGRDNGIMDEPPVKYYLMGDPTDPSAPGNVWKTADNWPVPSTPTSYYIHSGGLLSTTPPEAGEPAAMYDFNPADPVPTYGGANLYLPAGPYDQRVVLYRPDVLLYLTPPLAQPVAITGRIKARLWVSSSALDTDFTVKLMDVYDDWTAELVQDGILRMRFREGQDHEALMTPGEIYEVEIDLWSTALAFNRGHMIGIAISSSNYSRFDVNPNTGGPLNVPQDGIIASQVVYQDADHPSQIILPVVPLE